MFETDMPKSKWSHATYELNGALLLIFLFPKKNYNFFWGGGVNVLRGGRVRHLTPPGGRGRRESSSARGGESAREQTGRQAGRQRREHARAAGWTGTSPPQLRPRRKMSTTDVCWKFCHFGRAQRGGRRHKEKKRQKHADSSLCVCEREKKLPLGFNELTAEDLRSPSVKTATEQWADTRTHAQTVMMESILDSLAAEKLYPSGGTNLLDLEELSDGDFLTNVVSLNPVQLARTVFFLFVFVF